MGQNTGEAVGKTEEIAKNVGSEEYALGREALEHEWITCYGALEEKYLTLIEKELRSNAAESREVLRTLFSDGQFLQIFGQRNAVMEMKFIMDIYEAELQAGVVNTILDISAKGIDELRKCIRGLRFIIWRIEFAGDRGADEEICTKIQSGCISPIMLLCVVKAATEDERNILLHLADLFMDKQMFLYAYYMLKELQKQMPEESGIQELLLELERYLQKYDR